MARQSRHFAFTAAGTYGPITVTATSRVAPDATDTFTIVVHARASPRTQAHGARR